MPLSSSSGVNRPGGPPARWNRREGLVGEAAVNEAVVTAVRNAKFSSGTKNGIPVRMWRPVVVEVKP